MCNLASGFKYFPVGTLLGDKMFVIYLSASNSSFHVREQVRCRQIYSQQRQARTWQVDVSERVSGGRPCGSQDVDRLVRHVVAVAEIQLG